MSSTLSTAHRRDFCRALHLTPSDKKFGCGALYVCVYFALASDSYAERVKGAEAAERVLLITDSPFGPSGLLGPLTPLQALLLISREAHLTFQFSVFTFHFKSLLSLPSFTPPK